MREGFLLDPDVAYFNHGSYGACPVEVFAEYQRWQLELEDQGGERGERFPGPSEAEPGERWSAEAQRSPQRSPEKSPSNQGFGERGERGERFSFPYACARTRAIEDPGKPSPPSPRSPNAGNPRASAGERAGERPEARSPAAGCAPNDHWEELI